MISILLHIPNQEPVKVDVETLPDPSDAFILGKNPRERNDREVDWLDEGVNTIIVPWWRINFVQVLPSRDEELDFPLLYRES